MIKIGTIHIDESIHERFEIIWITTKNMVQWKGLSNINNVNYLNTQQCNKKVEQLQQQINNLNKRILVLEMIFFSLNWF